MGGGTMSKGVQRPSSVHLFFLNNETMCGRSVKGLCGSVGEGEKLSH